jgi:hypothetical protein
VSPVRTGDSFGNDNVGLSDHDVSDEPSASFDDAESMLAMVRRVEADLDRFPAEDQATVEQFLAALEATVDNSEAAFGDDDADTLLAGTARLVELFAERDCDGFLR